MAIPKDKIYHFLAGLAIGLVSLIFFRDVAAPIVASLAIGVGKEVLWDAALHKGTPDAEDAVWTFAGGVVIAFLFEMVT